MPRENVGNIKMNYEVSGNGEPAVLITGLGGDVSFWYGMVPLLSDRFEVITFDFRNCGLTECPDEPFDMETLAGDVISLLDHLSITKAHVMGWSMGGNVAQEIALRYPERVASLTLVSTYMRRPSRSSYAMNAVLDCVRSGGDIECLFKIMQAFCMTEEAFRKREENGIDTPGKITSTLEQFASHLAAVDGFDSRLRAKDIRVPTRVIHGKSDIMVPPYMGEELAAEIEGADFVSIEGGGHTLSPKTYAWAFLEHASKYPISSEFTRK
ncbi:MAG: alpha/beta hydrolase [Methanomassiliicoccaceae archaeon]|nr:alpha/beta hydrolase [Methanomassiliicoccaceae archaeon]